MSVSIAAQLCRIVAPERLSDRFLSSGVLTASENRNLGEQVVLAYLFEVMQPWLPSTKLLPALTAALESEYPKLVDPQAEGTIDDRFERLLRTVNQTLNTVSEEGETDWIGNLNGIIMVLSGEELHFSQTGRCPAYLLQNNRIRQVTDDPAAAPQDPHPLKTFSNLATGLLKEGDQLLVANHELYREISLDALRRILTSTTPYQASLAISKELKREKNPAVSSIIFRFTGSAPAEAEAESVVLEEEMQSGFKKFGRRITPFIQKAKEVSEKAGSATLVAGKQAQGVWVEKVAPKATELANKGKEALKEQFSDKPVAAQAESPAPVVIPENRPVVETIISKKNRRKAELEAIAAAAEARVNEDPEEEEFASIVPSSEFELETKHTPESKVLSHAKSHATTLWSRVSPILLPLIEKAKAWLAIPGNKKKAALGAGVFILAFSVLITVRGASKPETATEGQSNVAILSDVTSLKDKIATAISLQQDVEASKDVETALVKLTSLKDPTSNQKEEADRLWDTIHTQSDTLTKTTRFTTESTHYPLDGDARGIVAVLPYFYGWNPLTSDLLRTGRGEISETQSSTPLVDSSDTIVSATRSSEADTAGYVLTKQAKVFRISQIGVTTNLRPVTPTVGDFAAGDAISSYAGNVYILDGKAGLLWKYPNTGTQYGKGVSIIDINKYDLKKAISFAIDGSFYILKSDGSLMKFASGKQDPAFEVKDVPLLAQKMVNPVAVVASETYSNIYVLDAGATSSPWSTARVLEFTKNGSYVQQYAFPKELTKVHGFDINPKEKKLWLLNDKDIHEFDI
ncbi:MAG TPA: hypothetical protein VLA04_01330 [Verrucomicrobiae bacterium]|nr:hypothetical protein [Verrucomicrobiae bacterium]